MRESRSGLRFPSRLEAVYERYSRARHSRLIAATVWPSILVYNLFLLIDYWLLPATFWLAVACHFALVTPLMLYVRHRMQQPARRWLRETLAASIPLAMGAQVLLIYALNDVSAASHYQYLNVGILIYANVNQRLEHRFALVTSALFLAVHISMVTICEADLDARLVSSTLLVAAAYISLNANFRMEASTRKAFLRRVHDQLLRDEAESAARRDPLTGLANRYQLERYLRALERSAAGEDLQLGLLMIDIDDFKHYNDALGHPAGDRCIQRVARVVADQLRHNQDIAIRYGGEEFLVLLNQAGRSDTRTVGERIRAAVERLDIRGANDEPITVSIGLSHGRLDSLSVDTLLRHADEALYDAKRNGRNRVES